MAFGKTSAALDAAAGKLTQDPSNYTTLDEVIKANKDFVLPELVQTYGEQGITGFLQLTGAVLGAATNDQIDWWEEGRRHRLVTATDGTGASVTFTDQTAKDNLQPNDIVLMLDTGTRLICQSGGLGSNAVMVKLDGSTVASGDIVGTTGAVIGNLHAQGTDQPSGFWDHEIVKRKNPFGIVKGRYEVSGSQATNVGWIDLGNGDYRWYIKGESEARKRFEDHREMTLLFGQQYDEDGGGTNLTNEMAGTDGYFTQVEARGTEFTDADGISSVADFDVMVKELDRNGSPSEYAMYVNRTLDLAITDAIAGIETGGGLAAAYGAFNNDADMAIKLGFKSFTRGGYTFHKHDWRLLNDPTLLGGASASKYMGAMVPLTNVVDPKTGGKAPALAMYYKAAGGYSREMEHWITGGGIMGYTNGDGGKDALTYHYRSEVALCVRAANQHALFTYAA